MHTHACASVLLLATTLMVADWNIQRAETLPTPAPAMSFLLTPETVQLADESLEQPPVVIPRTPAPAAMVPVSSTVIPVTNAKALAARQLPPVRYQSRRFTFFDKSSKPDVPIRLITKHTNLKKFYESPTTA